MTDINLENNSSNESVNDQLDGIYASDPTDGPTSEERWEIGLGQVSSSEQDAGILSDFSRRIPAHLPHVCHAAPDEGYALAVDVAKEGKRVIILAPPHLRPRQYLRWGSHAIIIDDDLDTGPGFHTAAEAMRDHFDLIVFICDPRRLSDEMIFTETEEMLLDLHLSFVLQSRERVFRLRPEEASDNVVLFKPPGVKFVYRSPGQSIN
ncbi:hypothetical protein CN159_15970 [Sinorhizobium meliloti]|uniref:hypothetical protein n=1 Tax=Rhizobium meliloti TaxID=382 RepID=UPI000FDB1BD4|nr:hypothetical protein [Sinorhizobium meliloti]MDE4555503.1 hypothetical protein [Sinorhizobium meliloti]RVK67252.1 hypothetical protein CN159_15970 [Sinorhizobium meliloti]